MYMRQTNKQASLTRTVIPATALWRGVCGRERKKNFTVERRPFSAKGAIMSTWYISKHGTKLLTFPPAPLAFTSAKQAKRKKEREREEGREEERGREGRRKRDREDKAKTGNVNYLVVCMNIL